jgi:membrane-bound transcription factor site-1 protease
VIRAADESAKKEAVDISTGILNPASMKQALVESATRLEKKTGSHIFEQGAGKLNLVGAAEILRTYVPRASLFPAELDLRDSACPYMWPYCKQPIYTRSRPTIANVTILNGMGVVGYVSEPPVWFPEKRAAAGAMGAVDGSFIQMRFEWSEVIWPWAGYLAIFIEVVQNPTTMAPDWQGATAEGYVELTVTSPPQPGDPGFDGASDERPPPWRKTKLRLPVKASLIATPPRSKRVLWDQFHSIRYPAPYVPRDNLAVTTDLLDWNADHLHTNFREVFNYGRKWGYHFEILGGDYSCFNASEYGTLLVVDPEEEFFKKEVAKLEDDVKNKGLSIVLFADWYNAEVVKRVRFFDENTLAWWTAITGGANIPAVNDLLAPYGIAFGDLIFTGQISSDKKTPGRGSGKASRIAEFSSGNSLARLPKGAYVWRADLQDQTANVLKRIGRKYKHSAAGGVPVLAAVQTMSTGAGAAAGGRVIVFGDSNCIDTAHLKTDCWWLLEELLAFAGSADARPPHLFPDSSALSEPLIDTGGGNMALPQRTVGNGLERWSNVIGEGKEIGQSCPLAVGKHEEFNLQTGEGGGGVRPAGDVGGGSTESQLLRGKLQAKRSEGEDWNNRGKNVHIPAPGEPELAEGGPVVVPEPGK